MKTLKYLKFIAPLILVVVILSSIQVSNQAPIPHNQFWPEPQSAMKPWIRWWWHGNAVDKQNITKRLQEFSEAGICI